MRPSRVLKVPQLCGKLVGLSRRLLKGKTPLGLDTESPLFHQHKQKQLSFPQSTSVINTCTFAFQKLESADRGYSKMEKKAEVCDSGSWVSLHTDAVFSAMPQAPEQQHQC